MDGIKSPKPHPTLRVCELFAGVGGFHVGLERAGMQVTWANQWEPGTRTQHAFDCYERHYPGICVNDDIGKVMDAHQKGTKVARPIPEHDVLVGGFPCQDYSVAKPLSLADGIEGKKGVLWWQIERWLRTFRPGYLFLENVDRLLNSPTNQRGRDFAVMLSCLSLLGYDVEWRVINAADYGFPQKRRRVFILGRHRSLGLAPVAHPIQWILSDGLLAEACPVRLRRPNELPEFDAGGCHFDLDKKDRHDPHKVSLDFGKGLKQTPFLNSGYMRDGQVWTLDVAAVSNRRPVRLRDVLQPSRDVSLDYCVKPSALAKWKYLKGAKSEHRVHPRTGFEYWYSEGGIPFPDNIDGPARTILTGEGGSAPSRFKHIIKPKPGSMYRRLTPIELERLNGFDDDWTAGMPDGRRAFCMGNALVVGLVEQIGKVLVAWASSIDSGVVCEKVAKPRKRAAR